MNSCGLSLKTHCHLPNFPILTKFLTINPNSSKLSFALVLCLPLNSTELDQSLGLLNEAVSHSGLIKISRDVLVEVAITAAFLTVGPLKDQRNQVILTGKVQIPFPANFTLLCTSDWNPIRNIIRYDKSTEQGSLAFALQMLL